MTGTATLARGPTPPRRDAASIRERLVPPGPRGGWVGWIGPLVVTLIGGLLRFVDLGRPHDLIFDETYYPKDALALLTFGHEQQFVEDANELILGLQDGKAWQALDLFKDTPAFVVHPPVGKWTIAVGEWILGATPFGWRFAVAVLGTLSILLVARIARRLTRSNLVGVMAGLLLALDGMHLTLSRTGLLDLVLMFWVLVAFGLLLIDRDRTRARLADLVERDGLTISRWGPRLGVRPWRWAAAIALGLACGVKWSGLWFLAFFAVMTVVWDISARRAVGVQWPWRATLLRDAPLAALSTVTIALAVYVLGWSGWLLTSGGWGRDWAASSESFAALRSLLHYHVEAWNFHVGLDSGHAYDSNALSWPLMTRPTALYWDLAENGSGTCGADKCASEVLALGNPIIWWAAALAMVHQLWRWIGRRDWRSGAVLVGIAAGWVPWLIYLDRTIFTFYTIVYTPFVVMALAMSLGTILGPRDASEERRRNGALVVGAFLLLVVAAAWWFYPIWTGQELPYELWRLRTWLPTWT